MANNTSPETPSHGLQVAFDASQTPPFGQMVAHMFGSANPDQKSGIVNRLLGGMGSAGAAVISHLNIQGINPTTRVMTTQQATLHARRADHCFVAQNRESWDRSVDKQL